MVQSIPDCFFVLVDKIGEWLSIWTVVHHMSYILPSCEENGPFVEDVACEIALSPISTTLSYPMRAKHVTSPSPNIGLSFIDYESCVRTAQRRRYRCLCLCYRLLVRMDENILRHYSNESTFIITIRKNEQTHETQLNYDVTLDETDSSVDWRATRRTTTRTRSLAEQHASES